MEAKDKMYIHRAEAHKYAQNNFTHPPFEWEVVSNHLERKNGIPQGTIRYSFYDDDNDLKYEGDIRIFEGEDGLVRQDIDFKLEDGQYTDLVNSFNTYRLYSTHIVIAYWIYDTYNHINIVCVIAGSDRGE